MPPVAHDGHKGGGAHPDHGTGGGSPGGSSGGAQHLAHSGLSSNIVMTLGGGALALGIGAALLLWFRARGRANAQS